MPQFALASVQHHTQRYQIFLQVIRHHQLVYHGPPVNSSVNHLHCRLKATFASVLLTCHRMANKLQLNVGQLKTTKE